jgi:two-component system nitrogen regulation response regulator GlnG
MARKARIPALDTETVEPPKDREGDDEIPRDVVLTILGHPDTGRVGEIATLPEGSVQLSRVTPDFFEPGTTDGFPLADPGLSRKPIHLAVKGDGSVEVQKIDAGSIDAGGKAVTPPHTFSASELEAGVVLDLGRRVALLLHHERRLPRTSESFDLIGESAAVLDIRDQIQRIADLEVPVLLRGETGTGKELVARALHRASRRKGAPYLAVNMAAIHASVAASELFGHKKGAFTGADADHEGYFARANGGTLFLDEIGETPVEVQVMLLRTLETGAIQRVGGTGEQVVDVRLITATDADLEALAKTGGFRAPLLHRLSGYEVFMPPLRERRSDIGRLFIHFLREELEKIGAAGRLESEDPKAVPWLGSEVVARLARYHWPGNVRQLRNVARQLAITNQDSAGVSVEKLERLLPERETGDLVEHPSKPAKKRRRPADVTEDELAQALARNRWRLEQTADDLSISRASLYMLIDKSARFRKAKDLTKDELMAAYEKSGGDLDRMSELLEVSRGGLRLRMKEILGEP